MRKQLGLLLTGLMLVFLLGGCGSNQSNTVPTPETPRQTQEDTNNYPLTITDSLGREITVDTQPARIVSLSPAITEILFAIGVEDRLIGVTDYCDYPPAAQDKPKVGSFNSINMELLVDSEPDVVFMAAGIQAEFVTHLEELGIKVITLDAETIDQVLANIRTAGIITGAVSAAEELVNSLAQRVKAVREKVVVSSRMPIVFFEVWDDPLMTAGSGSFIDDLIVTAGGVNTAADVNQRFAEFSLEVLLERDPDIYIINDHAHQPQDIKERPGFEGLKAVREDRVYAIKDDLVTLPGPRIIDGLEEMAKIIHPELFK